MYKLLASLLFIGAAGNTMAAVCPTTVNTNSDCGYLITLGAGGTLTGAAVAGASPYDGSDDGLIGIINNSGSAFTGSLTLSGSGNGGGLFAFDSDGICAYVSAAYCTSAPTGYEGPLTSFSGISFDGTTGTVNIAGLLNGASTFFSLEGSPASIAAGGGPVVTPSNAPEPGTSFLLGAGLLGLAYVARRRRAF